MDFSDDLSTPLIMEDVKPIDPGPVWYKFEPKHLSMAMIVSWALTGIIIGSTHMCDLSIYIIVDSIFLIGSLSMYFVGKWYRYIPFILYLAFGIPVLCNLDLGLVFISGSGSGSSGSGIGIDIYPAYLYGYLNTNVIVSIVTYICIYPSMIYHNS